MTWNKRKLQIVKERDATARTKEIFDEIKQALGVPYVNSIFRILASFPEFFDLFWREARSVLSQQEFFACGERLSAEAFTRVHNYFVVPPLRIGDKEINLNSRPQTALQDLVELYHYNSSVLLLLDAALVQGFENPAAEGAEANPVVIESRPAQKHVLWEEESAPPLRRRIYDDIKRTLKTQFLSSWYLQLGRWPDFLNAYWESLKPLLRTPLYEHHRLAMCDSALAFAATQTRRMRLSLAQMEEAGVPSTDIDMVVEVADLFLNLLSKQALNIAFARIGLENGTRTTAAA